VRHGGAAAPYEHVGITRAGAAWAFAIAIWDESRRRPAGLRPAGCSCSLAVVASTRSRQNSRVCLGAGWSSPSSTTRRSTVPHARVLRGPDDPWGRQEGSPAIGSYAGRHVESRRTLLYPDGGRARATRSCRGGARRSTRRCVFG
jgi:hypothetical protein